MSGDEASASSSSDAGRVAKPDPHSSLLILRLSALGDVIHTLPAVVALRNVPGSSGITWVVESQYRELVEMVGGVPAIPVSMKRWGRSLLTSRVQIVRAMKAIRGHQTSVDFQGLVKSAVLSYLSGARTRYGFDRDAIREKPALLFTNRHIAVDRSRHVVEWNLDLASAVAGQQLPLPLLDFTQFAESGPRDHDGAIALLPGAGRAGKQWPAARFRELAHQLGDRTVIVWGPGEEALARSIGGRIAPPTNLRELAHLLRSVSLVIGGDTGPLHLAAALGRPVIGLYGPTSERRNGPYGQLSNCISTFDSSKSMEGICVEEVLAMARRSAG